MTKKKGGAGGELGIDAFPNKWKKGSERERRGNGAKL